MRTGPQKGLTTAASKPVAVCLILGRTAAVQLQVRGEKPLFLKKGGGGSYRGKPGVSRSRPSAGRICAVGAARPTNGGFDTPSPTNGGFDAPSRNTSPLQIFVPWHQSIKFQIRLDTDLARHWWEKAGKWDPYPSPALVCLSP